MIAMVRGEQGEEENDSNDDPSDVIVDDGIYQLKMCNKKKNEEKVSEGETISFFIIPYPHPFHMFA